MNGVYSYEEEIPAQGYTRLDKVKRTHRSVAFTNFEIDTPPQRRLRDDNPENLAAVILIPQSWPEVVSVSVMSM